MEHMGKDFGILGMEVMAAILFQMDRVMSSRRSRDRRSSCELFFVVFSRLGGPLRHHELHAELAEPKAKASGNRVRMGWII